MPRISMTATHTRPDTASVSTLIRQANLHLAALGQPMQSQGEGIAQAYDEESTIGQLVRRSSTSG